MKSIFKWRRTFIILGIIAIPGLSHCEIASTTVTITRRAPLETLSASGDAVGVSEASPGTKFTLVSATGEKVVLKDANGTEYRVALAATDYTPLAKAPSSTVSTATNTASPTAPTVTIAPVAKPIQLQFTAPDSVQEDLVGSVKSVDEKSYKLQNGQPGESDGASFSSYNAQGGALEKSKWDKDRNLKEKIVTTYDSNGNVLGQQSLGADASITSTWTLTFDPATKTMTADKKTPDGILQERKVTIYDNWGKEHEVSHVDAQGNLLKRSTMQRDANGKETTIVFYGSDNQPQTTISVEWNSDGSQSSESFSADDKGVSSRTSYDYPDHDSQGNWVTRNAKTVFQKNGNVLFEVDTVTERKITYY